VGYFNFKFKIFYIQPNPLEAR